MKNSNRGIVYHQAFLSSLEKTPALWYTSLKMKSNKPSNFNFTRQTHFIGVILPEDLTLTLEDCRRYMREAYGCKSGHSTPLHVTLIPPFILPDEYTTQDLADAIEGEIMSGEAGFISHIDNFDAFGDRTLFAKVSADEKWTRLRDAVYSAVMKAAPGCIKKDSRPFTPHISVSNRDIPEGVMTDALKIMNELDLVEDFPVDNITIFERKNGRWINAGEMELQVR